MKYEKGFAVIGIGDNYAEMALNLALSINANKGKGLGIALFHDGPLPYTVACRAHLFTNVIDLAQVPAYKSAPLKANLQKAMYAKLLLNDISPFEKTILVDADTLILPGRNVNELFEKCAGSSFLAMTVGYKSPDAVNLEKYTFWCDPTEVYEYFAIPTESPMPQINASFIYFDQGPVAYSVFRRALFIWNDTSFTKFTPHHRFKTEEFCFNTACAIEGVYPVPEGKKIFHPIFSKMYFHEWTEAKLYQEFIAFTLAGAELGKENDYRLARLYNSLTEHYRRIFGVGDDFLIEANSKSRKPNKLPYRGYWHVYAKNNWLDVVMEQIYIICSSGLYEKTEQITVGFIGSKTSLEVFKRLMAPYEKVYVAYATENALYYEYPTLNMLKDDADAAKGEFYGYYFHTKGTSKPDDHSRPWREYMNHYVLRLWNKSVEALDAGYETSGCNWIVAKECWEHHYSGNFWWFRSNYIKVLPSLLILQRTNRYEAEMWLGKAKPKAYVLSQKEVNTVHSPAFHPKRKIGLFVAASIAGDCTAPFLTALGASGLMDEAEFTEAIFYPKNKIENVLHKQNKFSTVKEFADHSNALVQLSTDAQEWCKKNPTGVLAVLCPTYNEALNHLIMETLITGWADCYKKIDGGVPSLGYVFTAGDNTPTYLANSFWVAAGCISSVNIVKSTISGSDYYRLPLVTNEGV